MNWVGNGTWDDEQFVLTARVQFTVQVQGYAAIKLCALFRFTAIQILRPRVDVVLHRNGRSCYIDKSYK